MANICDQNKNARQKIKRISLKAQNFKSKRTHPIDANSTCLQRNRSPNVTHKTGSFGQHVIRIAVWDSTVVVQH